MLMMRRKKIFLFLLVFLTLFLQSIRIDANEYYDNHRDWNDYCMRARNVNISKNEFLELQNNGTLYQEITNRSQIVIKKIKGNLKYENLENYQKNIFLQINDIEKVKLVEDTLFLTGIFYIDDSDISENYLNITIIVQNTKSSEGGIIDNIENTNDNNRNDNYSANSSEDSNNVLSSVKLPALNSYVRVKDKEDFHLLKWLFSGQEYQMYIPILGMFITLTPLSIAQFSLSLLILIIGAFLIVGDFIFYRNYQKKIKEYLCIKYKQ